jgi:pimeloyl-ACP methyl ester carboxylesterase
MLPLATNLAACMNPEGLVARTVCLTRASVSAEAEEPSSAAARSPKAYAPRSIIFARAAKAESNAARLAAAVPGANIVVLPGIGHLPEVEAPQVVNKLVAQHLGSGHLR